MDMMVNMRTAFWKWAAWTRSVSQRPLCVDPRLRQASALPEPGQNEDLYFVRFGSVQDRDLFYWRDEVDRSFAMGPPLRAVPRHQLFGYSRMNQNASETGYQVAEEERAGDEAHFGKAAETMSDR